LKETAVSIDTNAKFPPRQIQSRWGYCPRNEQCAHVSLDPWALHYVEVKKKKKNSL